jgi:multiple sugar transport system ATP-binding protein
MDEPLSNLDAKLRVQMRTEITKLHQRLQTTFIYVTHDQTEAMTLGTRIVVMKDGIIQQVDSPINLYNKPQNLFVAGFIGSPQMNLIDTTVENKNGVVYLHFGENAVKLPESKGKVLLEGGYTGKTVIMGIRPEDMHDEEMFISTSPDSIIETDVEVTELLGAEVYLYVIAAGQNLTARVNPRTTAKPHDKLKMALDANRIHVFDKETELTIVN